MLPKRLSQLAATMTVAALALLVREAMRSLRESDRHDPWGPHQKGL